MKTSIVFILLFHVFLNVNAQFMSSPAFPGAEGFGRYTTGGRGGVVYHVTNLNDYCDDSNYGTKISDSDSRAQGTLRYAIRQSGARIIVFAVAGIIDLVCPLKIKNDNVSVLGQTAPGDGICLKNYTFNISANNVIIRFLRCRMGDEKATEDDAMNSYQKTGNEKSNVIIDHCSLSWSTDECGSFYGNRQFTLQWCILSESLRHSVHDKGEHGYGGIWGGESAAFHHNLLAHHDSRNPRFDHGYVSTLSGPVDYVNNVVYNWGKNSTYGGENKPGCEAKKINMINNYYKPGPYTKDSVKKANLLLNPTTKCSNCNSSNSSDVVPGLFYLSGNYVNGQLAAVNTTNLKFDSNYNLDKFNDNCVLSSRALSSSQDFNKYNTISVHSAADAYNKVLQYAGASLRRDVVDASVCDDVEKGIAKFHGSKYETPGLIDTQTDVKGNRTSAWPTLVGTPITDSDRDGMPDSWEENNGLNPNDASDANKYTIDNTKKYYTNIEVYANSLVEDIVKAERAGATKTFEEYYPLTNSNGDDIQDDDDIQGDGYEIGGSELPVTKGLSLRFYSSDEINAATTSRVYCKNFTVAASSEKSVSIAASNKVIEGKSFSYCLKLGGSGTTNARYVSFPVKGNCTIKVYGISSNSAATRSLVISCGTSQNETVLKTDFCVSSSSPVAETYSYNGGATTIYIYSPNSGYNIYGIDVCYSNTYTWDFVNCRPSILSAANFQNGNTGSLVSTADNNGAKVNLNVVQTGKFAYRSASGDCQLNSGTVFRIPVQSVKDVVSIEFSGNAVNTFVHNNSMTANSSVTASYSDLARGYMEFIVNGGSSYIKSITLTQYDYEQINPSLAMFTYNGKRYDASEIFSQSGEKTLKGCISIEMDENLPDKASDFTSVTTACGVARIKEIKKVSELRGEVTISVTNYGDEATYVLSVIRVGESENGYYMIPANDSQYFLLALAAANASTEGRKYLFLPNGTYDLGTTVLTGITSNGISLIGESKNGVIIKNAPPASIESIDNTATICNSATGTYLQDLTIQNALDYYTSNNGRAVAFWDKGTETIYKNVNLLSYQDTYYTNRNSGWYYFEGGSIHGTVDFICGEGNAYFRNVNLHCEQRNTSQTGSDCITANSSVSTDKGYVFDGCTITTDNVPVVSLGRAWNNTPKVVFMNTVVSNPSDFSFNKSSDISRWTISGINTVPAAFCEYNTRSLSGAVISPSSNIVTFKSDANSVVKETIINASQASQYDYNSFFDTNQWNPSLLAKQLSAPSSVTLSGSTLSWNSVPQAYAYAVVKNGHVIAITKSLSYEIDDVDSDYAVRAANAMGGFGEQSSQTNVINSLSPIKKECKVSTTYNLNGHPVNKAYKGIVIKNGQKVLRIDN